ncbi:MAG: 2-hydroxyacid dehydrogenase [Caulobacterales bacterium]
MKVAVFSAKSYDRAFLDASNQPHRHDLIYFDAHLTPATAQLAGGCEAVCAFVNDDLTRPVLERLVEAHVRLVVLRSAGFNNVDLECADRLGLAIGRVPAYSPNAVAEHTVALMLTLNRKVHRAYNRVREGNFALDGLMGFDLAGKTIGIIGAGLIGTIVARIMKGFGCRVLGYDPQAGDAARDAGIAFAPLLDLLQESHVVTLHCPLTPSTRHLLNAKTLAQMRDGALLINTSRGAVIDTPAVIEALKTGKLGGLALDVYEEEADLFFEDKSNLILPDDVFARLLTFPNVLITGHQGFFTVEAMTAIAQVTFENLDAFENTGRPAYPVPFERQAPLDRR